MEWRKWVLPADEKKEERKKQIRLELEKFSWTAFRGSFLSSQEQFKYTV
jgi:hypothetical protein